MPFTLPCCPCRALHTFVPCPCRARLSLCRVVHVPCQALTVPCHAVPVPGQLPCRARAVPHHFRAPCPFPCPLKPCRVVPCPTYTVPKSCPCRVFSCRAVPCRQGLLDTSTFWDVLETILVYIWKARKSYYWSGFGRALINHILPYTVAGRLSYNIS